MKSKKSILQRLFPDTKVAAYYDPFSQIINLSKYNQSDYEGIDYNNPNIDIIDKVSLFEHELTHWLDHVSTLWGQRNLVLIYNSINARVNGDIDEFWRIKELYKNCAGDDFFDYFTEEYYFSAEPVRTPWKYQISSGIRFSECGKPEYEKPILFLKFSSLNDVPLIRIPVSVASILESNAINAEYILKISIANSIEDIVEKNRVILEIKREWLSMLYDKDFALYTVIAHLTANLNKQSDVVVTYSQTASIGTTILNLPEDMYERMKLTKIGDELWDRKVKEFQNIKDKGFTFYNLLKNLIDDNGENQYSIENLLSSSELPTIDELEKIVIQEMEKTKELLIEGPFKKKALDILNKGLEIFMIRGIDGSKANFRANLFEKGYLPKVIFGDTEFDDSNFKINDIIKKLEEDSDLTIDEIYLTNLFFDSKFSEFINACGV